MNISKPPGALSLGKKIAVLGVTALMALSTASPAMADEPVPNSGNLTEVALGTTTSVTEYDPNCVEQVKDIAQKQGIADPNLDICEFTITTTVSAGKTPTLADIWSDEGLSATAKSQLAQSVLAGNRIVTRNWIQQVNGVAYLQTHRGRAYADGNRAWSTNSYRGVSGYHACNTDYIVGGAINMQYCGGWFTGNKLVQQHQFTVSAYFEGFPVTVSRAMTTHIGVGGRVWKTWRHL